MTDAPTTDTTEASEQAWCAMDDLVWHYVLSLVVPLWTPVSMAAPVTTFNYDDAFKAIAIRHGNPIPETAAGLVALQARRMAEDSYRQATKAKRDAEEAEGLAKEELRIQQRLAKEEKERAARAQERERQAQADAQTIGEFTLD